MIYNNDSFSWLYLLNLQIRLKIISTRFYKYFINYDLAIYFRIINIVTLLTLVDSFKRCLKMLDKLKKKWKK